MRIFVVRHVKAGDRKKWKHAPDAERPVSASGRQQAERLAERLADEGVSRLVSSPSLRCVQSLEPLATRLGLGVETDERLFEGSTFEESLALVRELPDRAVLCSHGDVIPELISALVRRGTDLVTPPDWRKASMWVLDGPAGDDGRSDGDPIFTTAAAEPPPN
jgi:8-oxo-dGTP diphosphatase